MNGESAGAISIALLLQDPLSVSLISGAFLQSGSLSIAFSGETFQGWKISEVALPFIRRY